MDLRTARPSYGAPEASLHSAAAADLGRFLGLPFMGTAGASESKLLDAQAGLEAALQVLMSCLSGAGLVHDVGFLDCADIGSLPMLVLVDEIVGMARRIMRGVEVSPAAIMLDLIEKVGPGSHYLTEARSASLCRSEIWIPRLLDRDPYAVWEKKGRKSFEERVNESLQKILASHQPPPLPDGVEQKIRVILDEAERRTA
jgi:trimethylamine--corrinoid protein Co-methyltransferase